MVSARSVFLLLSAIFWLSACADGPKKTAATAPVSERIYGASFEDVERAIKQVMVKYPIRVDNLDAGVFETDYIKGDLRWKPPQTPDLVQDAGYRYRLLLHLLKGVPGKHPTTKVVINKAIEQQADFFSDPDLLVSDGLEEKVLLYRIGREIAVDKAGKKVQEKQNQDARKGFQQ